LPFIVGIGLATVTFGFAVAPMGLSGTYLPFGNYPKAGKVGHGLSWSKNLDDELQLRYWKYLYISITLCLCIKLCKRYDCDCDIASIRLKITKCVSFLYF
jgi:hypothetical protein